MADEVDVGMEGDDKHEEKTPQGFISFSGERSKKVAEILRDELDDLLSEVDLFVSEHDIASGARWRGEIEEELNNAQFGILCVTPENKGEEWLLFEAGALSRQDKRVVPYLLGLEKTDLSGPLADIQAVEANKEDTWEMIQEFRASFEPDSEKRDGLVKKGFERSWPVMEEGFAELRDAGPAGSQEDRRTQEDMVREALELIREVHSFQLDLNERQRNRKAHGRPVEGAARTQGDMFRISEIWENFMRSFIGRLLHNYFGVADARALGAASMRVVVKVLQERGWKQAGKIAERIVTAQIDLKDHYMTEDMDVEEVFNPDYLRG